MVKKILGLHEKRYTPGRILTDGIKIYKFENLPFIAVN